MRPSAYRLKSPALPAQNPLLTPLKVLNIMNRGKAPFSSLNQRVIAIRGKNTEHIKEKEKPEASPSSMILRVGGYLNFLCLLTLWQTRHSSLGGCSSPLANSPPSPWHVRQYSTFTRSTCASLSGMRGERLPLIRLSNAITTSTNTTKTTVCIRGESFLAFFCSLLSIIFTVYHTSRMHHICYCTSRMHCIWGWRTPAYFWLECKREVGYYPTRSVPGSYSTSTRTVRIESKALHLGLVFEAVYFIGNLFATVRIEGTLGTGIFICYDGDRRCP